MPMTRTSFSIDECACCEVYTVSWSPETPPRLLRPPVARSRAASKATSEEDEAVAWMTPPPVEVE